MSEHPTPPPAESQPATQNQERRIFSAAQIAQRVQELKEQATALGFEQVGVASIDLTQDAERFKAWLSQGFHADMDYLAKHGEKRYRPELLIPGTLSIICVRLNYLFPGLESLKVLKDPSKAYISRYALGRDYHKVLRQKLKKLALALQDKWGAFGYRVFTDSAPVLEKPLAQKAGLGWMGKHTLILDKTAGSWFFLGELFTDLPLPQTEAVAPSCGKCKACITVCPTRAIVAPYQLDAGRCISYLTIENKGPIPKPLRPLIGNRIFGCDDCQLVCPWNRWAQPTQEADFSPRGNLATADIESLLRWNEKEFLSRTEGSPIRRPGYFGWIRNLAVAASNAPGDPRLIQTLTEKLEALRPKDNGTHTSDGTEGNIDSTNSEDSKKGAAADNERPHEVVSDVPTPDWLIEHLEDALAAQTEKHRTAN